MLKEVFVPVVFIQRLMSPTDTVAGAEQDSYPAALIRLEEMLEVFYRETGINQNLFYGQIEKRFKL